MKIRQVIDTDAPGLGAKIKQARELDGRSLTQICKIATMSRKNWYAIEDETTQYLPLATFKKIEAALGVDFGIDFSK